ncbi:MAG: glycoside hydrolase [Candidatus Solibacter sp.]|nr:glycoside hydrolase [Candidatus Solibacter sp.]
MKLLALILLAISARAAALNPEEFRHYVEALNRSDPEGTTGFIPNAETWQWMKDNVPFLSVPDRELELTYYYRWWAYRKHIEMTPAGYVLTEFLRPVKHSTDYNAISCALGLHIAEGRWLRNPKYLDDYIAFWLRSGADGGLERHYHQFSNWTADAVYDRWLADGNTASLTAQLESLRKDYAAWETERLTPSGLFWQRDVSDGMESSISGGRKVKNLRPTINSYMFANARAIAAIAALAGKTAVRDEYARKADGLRKLTVARMWNPADQFFETVLEDGKFAGVREQIGFTPWYFELPERGGRLEIAWKQVTDTQGFSAPYGLTTAERRHAEFQIAAQGDDCQWNGPAWPFATSMTLRALANVLNDYTQGAVSAKDYRQTLDVYTKSQRIKRADGQVVPWVDEDLNPLTGVWWARELKLRKKTYYGRGDHYNHSSYADLVITGLIGLRPRADDTVEVNPLAPPEWDWFALDRIPYHGHDLAIVWDRSGAHFQKGAGLRIYSDGKEIAHAVSMERLAGKL